MEKFSKAFSIFFYSFLKIEFYLNIQKSFTSKMKEKKIEQIRIKDQKSNII